MNDELQLTCAGTNKRPEKSDAMRREAASKLVDRMVRSGAIEKSQAADSIGDIVRATRYEQNDGYKIARELENSCHWDCDMEIAEEMEQFSGILDSVYDAAEKQWDKDNPREPVFSEGSAVRWRGEAATVHGVYESRPQCYKVRQGEMRGGPTSFYTVPFEDVSSPD